MAIVVVCSHCQAKAQVGDNLLGKLVKCPKCGQAFTAAPAASAAPVGVHSLPPPVGVQSLPPPAPDVVQGELLTPEEEAALERGSFRERQEIDRPPRYRDERAEWEEPVLATTSSDRGGYLRWRRANRPESRRRR